MKKISRIFVAALMLAAAPTAVIAVEAPAAEISVQQAPSVKVRAGGVEIEVPGSEPQHVVIYALTGQMVKQTDCAPGVTSIDLSAGYYIVRIGHTTVKVAVK